MSNTLKDLVENIRFYRKMTVEEIAKSIGYSRVHLQKEMGKGDNPDLVRLLNEKYPDLKQSVSRESNNGHSEVKEPSVSYSQPIQERYIKLLEDSLKEKGDQLKEQSIELRLRAIEENQKAFLSKLDRVLSVLSESGHLPPDIHEQIVEREYTNKRGAKDTKGKSKG